MRTRCHQCGHKHICHVDQKREYAAKNPHNGKIIEVPGHTLENALKLVKLIPETTVMTRTVSEYTEWQPWGQSSVQVPDPR